MFPRGVRGRIEVEPPKEQVPCQADFGSGGPDPGFTDPGHVDAPSADRERTVHG